MKPDLSIRFAISSCLGQCLASATQFTCLKDYAEKLAAQGWDHESIAAVENGVIELLKRDTFSCDSDATERRSVV